MDFQPRSLAGRLAGGRFVYFGDCQFGSKAIVVVIPDRDAVMHIEFREMEDVVCVSADREAQVNAARFAQCLKNGEALLAARFDNPFDFYDLKTASVGPNAPDKKSFMHAMRVGLLNWRHVKRKHIA